MQSRIRTIIKIVLILLVCVSAVGVGVKLVTGYLAERANRDAHLLAGIATPEPVIPATIAPETTVPETEAPETIPPATEAVETTTVETTAPETTTVITTIPETTAPETTAPETDDYAQSLLATDLTELRKTNEDVFGWIVIPDTTISYPLLQGDDNSHYLNYAWNGWWNPAGSIFLDYRSSQAMTDFHTIIYGHRMYDDSMFNALKNYEDADFAAEHPSVYIYTDDGVRRYDVFAAYEADVENGHSYRLGLKTAEDQQKLVNYARRRSVIAPEIEVDAAEGDRMLTLSTCTRAGTPEARWVVHFVLGFEILHEE